MEVFVGIIIKLEYVDMPALVVVLRGAVDDVGEAALLEEDFATVVDELRIDSVIVTGSGTSTVVGELTSMIE